MVRTFATLTWIELKLFVREPLNLVFVIAFPALVVMIMGAAFGNTPDPTGQYYRGLGPMNYYYLPTSGWRSPRSGLSEYLCILRPTGSGVSCAGCGHRVCRLGLWCLRWRS